MLLNRMRKKYRKLSEAQLKEIIKSAEKEVDQMDPADYYRGGGVACVNGKKRVMGRPRRKGL